MNTSSPAVRVNLSYAFHNKENLTRDDSAFGNHFNPVTIGLSELATHIASGNAFTPNAFKHNRRIGTEWESSQIFGLDLDKCLLNADEIAAIPDFRDNAWLVYPTASSTPEIPRTRVLFVLSTAVTEPERWLTIQLALFAHFKALILDTGCKDLARMFYGSTQPGHILLGNVARWDWLGGLCLPQAVADYEKTLLRQQEKPRVVISGSRAEKYAQAAFNKAIDELAGAGEGKRNTTLFKVSAQLQGMVLGGWPGLDNATIRRAIQSIYEGWDNTAKSEKTMENGFKAATVKLLELPEMSPTKPKTSLAHSDDGTNSLTRNKPTHPNPKQVLQSPVDDCFGSSQAPIAVIPDELAVRWGIGLWRQGLPNSVRSALLNYMPKGTALIVEILNAVIMAKWINPQAFTRPELRDAAHELGYAISERTLYRYMHVLEYDEMTYGVQIFFSVIGITPLAKERMAPILSDLGIKTKSITPKFDNNGNLRPRTALVYRLHETDIQQSAVEKYAYPRMLEAYHPTRGAEPIIALLHDSMIEGMEKDQVMAWNSGVTEAVSQQNLHQQESNKRFTKAFRRWQKALTESESFKLPSNWPISNHREYIIAFAHAYGTATEGEYNSQTKWTKVLGVVTNSVSDTLHRAGLMEITPRDCVYAAINIDAPNVAEQINHARRTQKGYPDVWETYAADGKLTESISYNPNPQAIAAVVQHFREKKVRVAQLKLLMAYACRVVSDIPVKVEKKKVDKRTPQEGTETPTRQAKNFRAPAHDPQWLADQSRKVMDKHGLWRGDWNFVNGDGEIVEAKDNLAIARVYASHIPNENLPIEPDPFETVDMEWFPSRQVIDDQMAARGWRKILIS